MDASTDQTTDHLSGAQARCTCEGCPHPWKDPKCAIHTTPEDRAFFDFAQAFFGRWEDGPGEDIEKLWEADLRPAFDKAAVTLATYYEDKGAERERQKARNALALAEQTNENEMRVEQANTDLRRELAAAEDKGRSEERERLRASSVSLHPGETARIERHGHDHIWHRLIESAALTVRYCGYDHCEAISIREGEDEASTYLPASFDNACLAGRTGAPLASLDSDRE